MSSKKAFTSWVSSTKATGEYIRKASAFQQVTGLTIEKDRYHLYVSYACPWACRTLLVRALLGLEDAVSVDVVDPFLGPSGWAFHMPSDAPQYRPGIEENDDRDSVNHKRFLREVYFESDPEYEGNITVPVLFDKKENRIVNNESSQIIRLFNKEFRSLSTNQDAPNLYPDELAAQIDEVNAWVYPGINNGVYRSGFAKSQEAYDKAVKEVFETLDRAEQVLSSQRYLVGNTFTEADVRLFTTLVRFDSVYHTHFKCNHRRIADYPALLNHTRDVYQLHPGIAATVNDAHIRFHYYQSHNHINPTRIVPEGPQEDFSKPHDRDRFDKK